MNWKRDVLLVAGGLQITPVLATYTLL